MTPSNLFRPAAQATSAVSSSTWRASARAPRRAEIIGLGLALLMAGALIALLRGSMDTARQRRLDDAATQRVLLACERMPLASERHACRQARQEPAAAAGSALQRQAGG